MSCSAREGLSFNQKFILQCFSSPVPVLYTCINLVIMKQLFSEATRPISTKFHVNPIGEVALRVCSNGHAQLTVRSIYGKK